MRAPRVRRGHEQAGPRYAVVVQADAMLGSSTVLVAPTSTRASPASFRPAIMLEGTVTRVMVEQMRAVDLHSLGGTAGRLDASELRLLDEALTLVLGLY